MPRLVEQNKYSNGLPMKTSIFQGREIVPTYEDW